jgi:hypothetical protein
MTGLCPRGRSHSALTADWKGMARPQMLLTPSRTATNARKWDVLEVYSRVDLEDVSRSKTSKIRIATRVAATRSDRNDSKLDHEKSRRRGTSALSGDSRRRRIQCGKSAKKEDHETMMKVTRLSSFRLGHFHAPYVDCCKSAELQGCGFRITGCMHCMTPT